MVLQEEIKRSAQKQPEFYIPIQPSWFIWHSLVVKQAVTLIGEKREANLLPQLRDPCLPK
jgi:hypothetical protein